MPVAESLQYGPCPLGIEFVLVAIDAPTDFLCGKRRARRQLEEAEDFLFHRF